LAVKDRIDVLLSGTNVNISPLPAAPSSLPAEETHTRRVPPYNVILENDDHHSMQFVADVLCKALGVTAERAVQFMLEAHTTGRAVVWTAPREVAELKAEQMQTFHETSEDGRQLGPVGCTVEPAPGA
jgi:ATP-dependent Clp protease adaptor protein ClpS